MAKAPARKGKPAPKPAKKPAAKPAPKTKPAAAKSKGAAKPAIKAKAAPLKAKVKAPKPAPAKKAPKAAPAKAAKKVAPKAKPVRAKAPPKPAPKPLKAPKAKPVKAAPPAPKPAKAPTPPPAPAKAPAPAPRPKPAPKAPKVVAPAPPPAPAPAPAPAPRAPEVQTAIGAAVPQAPPPAPAPAPAPEPEGPRFPAKPAPPIKPKPAPEPGGPRFSRPALPSESGRVFTAANLPRRPPEPRPATPDERKAAVERIFREQVASALPPTNLKTGKRAVLLDTNALMMQFQFHVDIETEVRRVLDIPYEILVPSVVMDELARLEKSGNAKEAQEARMASEFAKQFRVVDSPGEGDTAILRLAEQLHAVVVTNDKILRARLRAKDIPNIHMRSKAFLTVEGHLGLR